MAIRVGGNDGGSFRRRKQPARIVRGQQQKPFRPLENPFPEKEAFRFGVYKVLQLKEDYLICEGYDPRAKNPFAEVTPSAPRQISVAKPPLLQRTPWDGETVTIGGIEYTYEYTGTGKRTVTWTDEDSQDHEEDQQIEIPYFGNDVIVAVEVRRNPWQDGFKVEGEVVEDDNGAIISWVDLNVSGRHWALADEDGLRYAIGKTSLAVSAGNPATVNLYEDIQGTPAATGVTRFCHAFVDIDADKYVSTWWYDDGFYCSPLECND